VAYDNSTSKTTQQAPTPTPTLVFEDGIARAGFTMMPNALMKARNITHSAKMLYGFLLLYARQDHECFPGYDTLAADMGITEKSTRKYMGELEAVGLVRQKRRGLGMTNIYIIADLRTVNFTVPEKKEVRLRAGNSTVPEGEQVPTTKTQGTKTHYKNKGAHPPLNQKSYDDNAYTSGPYSNLVQRS